MEFLQVILTALGGAVSALAVVVFLGKSIVSHWFGKELEQYKGNIDRENNEAIETLKTDLQLYVKAEERSIELQLTMDRYRGPLIHASYDLQSRIYNLICQNVIQIYFVDNHGDGSEKDYFVKNTMFVIAQYFAWTEIIRKEVQFIEFDDIAYTKDLSNLQDGIYSIWQASQYSDFLGIWAGEQRGIGEVMIEEQGTRLSCIGYSNFLKLVNKGDEPLLMQLESKVNNYLNSGKYRTERLIHLQNALIDMLEFLDPKHKRFSGIKRTKIA